MYCAKTDFLKETDITIFIPDNLHFIAGKSIRDKERYCVIKSRTNLWKYININILKMCVINMKHFKVQEAKIDKTGRWQTATYTTKVGEFISISVINTAIRQITSNDMSGLKSVINSLDILDIYKIIHLTIEEMKIQCIKSYGTHIMPSFKENL